ncbi:MAG: type I restriction endonuclease subunit S [Desulfamplus sp.]|nr:type I restriction endonuclease subunit S [Desulfamplus sp.]
MIGRLKIPFPPFDEQIEIAKDIDFYTRQIDKQAAVINNAIVRLQEYRSVLITNAVTGKIDVHNFRLPEYDTTGESHA